ncbi:MULTISPECIES: YVTN family beta-propeller repeat protein [Cupriavidus]
MRKNPVVAVSVVVAVAAATWWVAKQAFATPANAPPPAEGSTQIGPVATVAGMPAVPDRSNLYSEAGAGMSPAVAGALERVYVPNHTSNTVSVIDPATLKVIETFNAGVNPQHVVPAWDLRTLWVTNNAEGRRDGSLTPIDPNTGKPGKSIRVEDPYNLYWSPDGQSAIVVAEAYKRLDFRDPHSMKLQYSIATPKCGGINHADFSIDGRFALFTCEFDEAVTKIDLVNRRVAGTLKLSKYFDRPDVLGLTATPGQKKARIADPSQVGSEIRTAMPQDVRVSPDGKVFFVADLMADGVHVVDGESFKQIGFIATGIGAHGLYPSRDARSLYVTNRGTNKIHGTPGGKGSVSVIDFATRTVTKTWPIPEGGSPDMGNVSVDGKHLWLSGRFDDVVYRIDTTTGGVDKIKVGREPHGLTVWPQPGRYSLGHTGNLR